MQSKLKHKRTDIAVAISQEPAHKANGLSAFDKISAGGFIRQDQLIGKRPVTAAQVAVNRQRHAAAAARGGKRLSLPVRERQGVTGIVPFSSATLWRKVRAGTFPAPCKLSTRIAAWRVGDVRQWLEAQAQA